MHDIVAELSLEVGLSSGEYSIVYSIAPIYASKYAHMRNRLYDLVEYWELTD